MTNTTACRTAILSPSRFTPPDPTPPRPASSRPTLAVVLAQILADTTLPPVRRRDMASGLRRFAKALDKPLDRLIADPSTLRAAQKAISPAMVGLTKGTWQNVISRVRAALKHTGVIHVAPRAHEPLDPQWAALFDLSHDRHTRFGLSRLVRYCSSRQIAPADVDDTVLAAFRDDLDAGALRGHPARVHRTACRLWNMMAEAHPTWPQQRLAVPDNRRIRSKPWSIFPDTLKADIDAYLDRRAHLDLTDEDAPPRRLNPTSLQTRLTQLHGFVSALVDRGVEPQTLRSLKDVVNIQTARRGLCFYLGADGHQTQHSWQIAYLLLAVARHWVKADEDQLKQLKSLCKQLDPRQHGMTAKNRALLRQFDDPANVAAWVMLPGRVFNEAAQFKTPTATLALEVQAAVAIEILQMVPLRIRNLVMLDLDRHLIRSPGGQMHLSIPLDEVKNDFAIEANLSDETVRRIELYLKRYRPLLSKDPSSALFPGRGRLYKCTRALRIQIVECAKQRARVKIHPHLCRHIAAKLHLDAYPGAYGTVRLLLGHKSVNTTTKFYCGAETKAAFSQFDQLIRKLRDNAAALAPARRR